MGIAKAIDGNTISVGGLRVRLYGLDVAMSAQFCGNRNGLYWPHDTRATDVLSGWADDEEVECLEVDCDQLG